MTPFDDIDPEKLKMHHAAQHGDQVEFFESLTESQMHYLGKMFRTIVGYGEDASGYASRYLGHTEAYMAMRFKMCGCGTRHDHDEALKLIVNDTTS